MAVPAILPATAVRHRAIPLALVLFSALLLRVALLAAACHNAPDLHTLYCRDTSSYLAPAESLLTDGTFSRDGAPEVIRTPGYPLLLAAGLLAGHVELVTVAVQIALSLATIALVYHLAWRLTANSTAALAASALAAFDPLSIIFTSHLMPETLFTFLLLASLALLLRYLRTSSALSLVATALLLAAATFVRPVSYYLPLALAPLLLLRALTRRSPTEPASGAGTGRLREAVLAFALAAICFAPLAAWQVRNYLVSGYSGFSAITDWNLYFYQGLSIVARQSGKSLEQLQSEIGKDDNRLFESLHPELRDAGQAAKFRFLKTEGSRLVRENLLTYAKIHAQGTALLILDPGAGQLLSNLDRYPQEGLRPIPNNVAELLRRAPREPAQYMRLRFALRAALGLVYCACLLGLPFVWRRLTWQWIFVLVVVAYFLAVSGGPTGYSRLRHPIMPPICILAGCGVAVLTNRLWDVLRRKSGQSRLTTDDTRPSYAACAYSGGHSSVPTRDVAAVGSK